MIKQIYYIIYTTINLVSVFATDWSYYGETGPDQWSEIYPTCGGDTQSPINIIEYDAVKEQMTDFLFVGFDGMPEEARLHLQNDGRTVKLNVIGKFYVLGGGLPAKYKLVVLDFHWDNLGIRGSEHALDGVKYPVEMHLAGYDADKYKDFDEAKLHPQGVAVLSTFIQVGGDDNEEFEQLLTGFEHVIYKNQTFKYPEPFPVLPMISRDRTSFFRYKGSLTAPSCEEAVVWTVFREHQRISQSQFDKFLALKATDQEASVDVPLGDNYRPLQATGNRQVYKRVEEGSTGTTCFNGKKTVILISLATAIRLIFIF